MSDRTFLLITLVWACVAYALSPIEQRTVVESIAAAPIHYAPCLTYQQSVDAYGEVGAFGMIEPADMLRCQGELNESINEQEI